MKVYKPTKGFIEKESKRFSPFKGLVDTGRNQLGIREDLDDSISLDSFGNAINSAADEKKMELKEIADREMLSTIDKLVQNTEKEKEEEKEEMKFQRKAELMHEQAEKISAPIVEAIQSIPETIIPEETKVSNLEEVSKPIVEAVGKIEIPDNTAEIQAIRQTAENVLKSIQEKNDKAVVDAIKSLPDRDYGKLLEEIKSRINPVDFTPVLEAIRNIPQFEIPQELIEKKRLKVAVDKIGMGGGGGVPQVMLDNIAELVELQEETKTAIENQTINLASGGKVTKEPTSASAIAGTVGAGTVDNAKFHDGSYMQFNEVAGQGLTAEFVYTVPSGQVLDALQFHGRYEGGGTHYIGIFMYDYVLTSWVEVSGSDTRITNGTTDLLRNISINNPNFVSGTEAKVRLVHNSATYSNAHRLYVDYVALQYQVPLDVEIDTTGLATEAKQDDLIVAVSAISGTAPYKLIKMAYDVDGNLEYKGSNTDEAAADGDTDWSIIKYVYDIDGNLTSKTTKTGSWTDRALLF